MLRNRRRLRRDLNQDGIENPLEGLSNLADVMLVFACGLMVSLVLSLNVDISRINEAIVQYKDNGNKGDIEKKDGRGMQKVGTVFKDPTTGKTYIIEEKGKKKSK